MVAGILRGADDRVLLGQRLAHKPHAGMWEFPGGKVEVGETARAALRRELSEELGIGLILASPFHHHVHSYTTGDIALEVWLVTQWHGEPVAREGQALVWVNTLELGRWAMPAADWPARDLLLTY